MPDHALEPFTFRRMLAIIAAASTLFLATVAIATTEGAGKDQGHEQPYAIAVVLAPHGAGQYAAQVTATERATHETVWGPYLVIKLPDAGSRTRWTVFMSRPVVEFTVKVSRNDAGAWISDVELWRDGRLVQRTTVESTALDRSAWIGEPIDISLTDADVRDVLVGLSRPARLEIVLAPEVQGTVTINVEGIPWDQLLDQVARDNGLSYKLEGAKLEVFK